MRNRPQSLPLQIALALAMATGTPVAVAGATAAGVVAAAPANVLPGMPADTLPAALALARTAAQALAPAGARVVVLPGALDSRLKLAPCPTVRPFLPAGAPAWGRTRVGLRCEGGAVAWQVHLPLTVQVWARAVVSPASLPAGAQLQPEQLANAEVDWAAAPGQPFRDPAMLAERVLQRPLAAGQPVRSADLRPRQWFAHGDTVRITAVGAGFRISAEGTAMAPGLEGQPARVRTESGRVITGTVVGARHVELHL